MFPIKCRAPHAHAKDVYVGWLICVCKVYESYWNLVHSSPKIKDQISKKDRVFTVIRVRTRARHQRGKEGRVPNMRITDCSRLSPIMAISYSTAVNRAGKRACMRAHNSTQCVSLPRPGVASKHGLIVSSFPAVKDLRYPLR